MNTRWTDERIEAALAVGFAVLLMAGCGDDGGGGGIRATAEALGTRFPNGRSEASATPFPSPAEAPVQVAPVQVIEATRIVEVTQPAQVIEVTRIVEVTQPAMVVEVTPAPMPACDPNVPQPTIALDATDVAAGVVMRGTGCLWVIQTAEAQP